MTVEEEKQKRCANFITQAELRGEDVTELIELYIQTFCPEEIYDAEIEEDKARIKRLTLKTWNIKKIDEMIDYLNHDKPLELK